MPLPKKRKITALAEPSNEASTELNPTTSAASPARDSEAEKPALLESSPNAVAASNMETLEKDQERKERFRALQARAVRRSTYCPFRLHYGNPSHVCKRLHCLQKKSAERNLKEAAAESQRLATDASALAALSRKHAFASHNLLKADTAAAGEDFERKRAWDWTIDESEKWDKRMAKKEKHREDVAFQDYRQDARKIYKRQLRDLKPDVEGYEKEKASAVQKSVLSGGLEVVEMENGELVALDKGGAFYTTADSTDFISNKPEKAAVDRLVNDLKKAEETRLRKRRERGQGDEDGDVTYINDKVREIAIYSHASSC